MFLPAGPFVFLGLLQIGVSASRTVSGFEPAPQVGLSASRMLSVLGSQLQTGVPASRTVLF